MRRSYGVPAFAAALVLLGSQAMAMAPMISDLPSPVVGNAPVASPPNAFVYPDAIDLDAFVSDDTTTDGAIIWSYDSTSGRYALNGVPNLGAGNQNAPSGSRLDTQDIDTAAVDSNPRTITIRDILLSPIGGPDVPAAPGIVNPAGDLVTLYASDGTTWTMGSMLVYTDSEGEDRLSGLNGDEVIAVDFQAATTTDWVSANLLDPATFSGPNGVGLCVQVPLSGGAGIISQWISPYGFIPLVANKAYRIRATVDAGTLPVGTTPLWAVVIDNFSVTPSVIENKYAQESFILDNTDGANSAGGSLKDYEIWFTPMPVGAADWNDGTNGMFTAAKDAINDMRVQFRVLDIDNIGYGGELDAGTICMQDIRVDSFDVNVLPISSTIFDRQNITNGAAGPAGVSNTGWTVTSVFAGTNAVYSGGNVTISPQAADTWDLEAIGFTPGNTTFDPIGNTPETPDNFPIVDIPNGLLKVTMGVQAPNALGETNPPDGIRLGVDDASTEVLQMANVLATTNALGMPKTASETVYTAIYNSHNVTASTGPEINRIRPRAQILNAPTVTLNGQQNNEGGIQINFMTVEQIDRGPLN